jgi:hypothetical protein
MAGETNQQDDKTKQCTDEMLAVLQKYDYAGAVIVVSPIVNHFDMFFPAWTALRREGIFINCCSRREDGVDANERLREIILTMTVLKSMTLRAQDITEVMVEVAKGIGAAIEESAGGEDSSVADGTGRVH